MPPRNETELEKAIRGIKAPDPSKELEKAIAGIKSPDPIKGLEKAIAGIKSPDVMAELSKAIASMRRGSGRISKKRKLSELEQSIENIKRKRGPWGRLRREASGKSRLPRSIRPPEGKGNFWRRAMEPIHKIIPPPPGEPSIVDRIIPEGLKPTAPGEDDWRGPYGKEGGVLTPRGFMEKRFHLPTARAVTDPGLLGRHEYAGQTDAFGKFTPHSIDEQLWAVGGEHGTRGEVGKIPQLGLVGAKEYRAKLRAAGEAGFDTIEEWENAVGRSRNQARVDREEWLREANKVLETERGERATRQVAADTEYMKVMDEYARKSREHEAQQKAHKDRMEGRRSERERAIAAEQQRVENLPHTMADKYSRPYDGGWRERQQAELGVNDITGEPLPQWGVGPVTGGSPWATGLGASKASPGQSSGWTPDARWPHQKAPPSIPESGATGRSVRDWEKDKGYVRPEPSFLKGSDFASSDQEYLHQRPDPVGGGIPHEARYQGRGVEGDSDYQSPMNQWMEERRGQAEAAGQSTARYQPSSPENRYKPFGGKRQQGQQVKPQRRSSAQQGGVPVPIQYSMGSPKADAYARREGMKSYRAHQTRSGVPKHKQAGYRSKFAHMMRGSAGHSGQDRAARGSSGRRRRRRRRTVRTGF